MFRNSAGLLCVFLLCFGHILSESQTHNEEKIPEKQTPVLPKKESSDKVVLEPHNLPVNRDAYGNEVVPKPPHKPTTTTTEAPKPTSTTPLPITTTPIPIITSSQPTTAKPTDKPTPKPTPEPTTQTPTSSASPITIPPSPSTSTPIPVTPHPGPHKGSWNVTNDKNITCIRIDGIFSIDYTPKNKTKVHFDVPEGAHANGTCKGDKGTITLTWQNVTASKANNSLEFIFKKNDTTHNYVLEAFSGAVFIAYLNKTEHFNTNNDQTHFQTSLNQSYSCSSLKQITVDNYTKVTLDEFHLQAFKSSNSTGFDASVDCAGSTEHTPDIVPIIVGCVLALLVIAVLVAYLISRRRSQTRGYLSM